MLPFMRRCCPTHCILLYQAILIAISQAFSAFLIITYYNSQNKLLICYYKARHLGWNQIQHYFPQIIDNMQQYSTRRSTNKSRGLELHSVLREFKKFEEQKQILQNRINIMHNNHVKNTNKARTIEDHLQKIKKAQKGRKQEQQSINRQISEQATEQVEKKKQKVRRIKQQKKNIETSKKIYKQYLLKNVRKVRSQSKINKQKIASGKQLALLSNRRRRQEINMSEELSRTKVSIFKNNKICSFKQQQNQRLLEQIQLNQSSRSQLSVLQKLQKEMVMKYSQSIRSLKTSRANMKRISLMRG